MNEAQSHNLLPPNLFYTGASSCLRDWICSQLNSWNLFTLKILPCTALRRRPWHPLQCSCLDKIPRPEEPGRLQFMGSRRVGHAWATSLSLFTFMHWRRKWQPTPVFLPGQPHGRRSLVGCLLWGRRVGHDWRDLAAAASLHCGEAISRPAARGRKWDARLRGSVAATASATEGWCFYTSLLKNGSCAFVFLNHIHLIDV